MSTIPHMFAHVPPGRPSVRAAYHAWLRGRTPLGNAEPAPGGSPPPRLGPLRVGIAGGGMAGLYAALLLQSRGVEVHVFEAHPERLGGRVYTHRFTPEPNQYFEAGAMRLPEIPEQQPVFELIDFLNERVPPEDRIETIPYVLFDDTGNLVLVNGKRLPDGRAMTAAYADDHPDALGFPLTGRDRRRTASQLLDEVLGRFHRLLERDFEAGFRELMRWDNYSLYGYLSQVARWKDETVNYAEVMTSQTNQFQNSFTELVIETLDFSTAAWKTIEDGMDRLPRAAAQLVGPENITLGARVYRLEELPDGRVAIHHTAGAPAVFDKVIAAVPPAVLRMWQTPQWPVTKEQAIRSLHFEPLYKIGMRFGTRFWEQVPRPARGGQSITDLPSRWFVYPSYGIGDAGPGALLLYSWMTDAYGWLPQSREERERIALRDLQTVYGDEVDVAGQFIESFDVAWPNEWATGDAMFFPGQFRHLFNVARQPEGNVHFAGEHLSVNHTWIVGALDSALLACQQILQDPNLQPLRAGTARRVDPHTYDYTPVLDVEPIPLAATVPVPDELLNRPVRWQFASL
ncbi:MAG TPA: FAD-dependent oxidoreductase [Longimicrobium sp.]|nr:FAD-dependent oxidoreductase [Longimicrobium sp.]